MRKSFLVLSCALNITSKEKCSECIVIFIAKDGLSWFPFLMIKTKSFE